MRTAGVVCILILLMAASASAEITLKKNFWWGWQYSTDGESYETVGISASSLKQEMAGNPEALELMGRYTTQKIFSTIFGAAGGFLVGWPLGGYIASNDWKDSYTTMLILGGSLTVISAIIEGAATQKLKSAVEIYNSANTESHLDVNLRYGKLGGDDALLVTLGLTF